MVHPRRFELLTFCSAGINRRRINGLAGWGPYCPFLLYVICIQSFTSTAIFKSGKLFPTLLRTA
jgi:hypothetical protein